MDDDQMNVSQQNQPDEPILENSTQCFQMQPEDTPSSSPPPEPIVKESSCASCDNSTRTPEVKIDPPPDPVPEEKKDMDDNPKVWDISCPFTLSKPDVSDSEEVLMKIDEVITKIEESEEMISDEPDVDMVDGIRIVSFENLEQMKQHSDREEEKNRIQNSIESKNRRCSISGSIGSNGLKHANGTKVARTDDMMSRTKIKDKMIKFDDTDSGHILTEKRSDVSSAKKSSASSINSAFVSDFLDTYLQRTQEDLKNFGNSFGAPPEDSKIYSTGILKMDSAKNPFSDLPKVTTPPKSMRPLNVSSKKKTGKRIPDNHLSDPHEPLSQQSSEEILKTPVKRITNIKKGKRKVMSTEKPNNNSCDVISVDSMENTCLNLSDDVAQNVFKDLMNDILSDIESRRNSCHVSLQMDDAYVRYALDTLRVTIPNVESPLQTKNRRSAESSLKSSSEDESGSGNSTPTTPVKKGRGDADLATIISRHSKRDIRLPLRYHNSGLMLGNQWVTPGVEPEKKMRRKLGDEQRRLQVIKKPVPRDLIISKDSMDRFLPLESPKIKSKQSKSSQKKGKSLLGPKKPIMKMSPTNVPQVKTEEMLKPKVAVSTVTDEDLSNLKPGLLYAMPSPLIQSTKSNPIMQLKAILGKNKLHPVEKIKRASPSEMVKSSLESNSSSERPKVIIPSKSTTTEHMKELYRNLFFECKPGCRSYYQQRGVKPRVHKKELVEKAVTFIQELEKKEKQLLYIKKLMTVWNSKLSLCKKVIMKEVIPEPTEGEGKDPETVVRKVLDAYQQSLCYKVQSHLHQKSPKVMTNDAAAGDHHVPQANQASIMNVKDPPTLVVGAKKRKSGNTKQPGLQISFVHPKNNNNGTKQTLNLNTEMKQSVFQHPPGTFAVPKRLTPPSSSPFPAVGTGVLRLQPIRPKASGTGTLNVIKIPNMNSAQVYQLKNGTMRLGPSSFRIKGSSITSSPKLTLSTVAGQQMVNSNGFLKLEPQNISAPTTYTAFCLKDDKLVPVGHTTGVNLNTSSIAIDTNLQQHMLPPPPPLRVMSTISPCGNQENNSLHTDVNV